MIIIEQTKILTEILAVVEALEIPFITSTVLSKNTLECSQIFNLILKYHNTGIDIHNKIWLPFSPSFNFKILKTLYDVPIDLIPRRGGPDLILFDTYKKTVDLFVQLKATDKLKPKPEHWFETNYEIYKKSCDFIQLGLFVKDSSSIYDINIPVECQHFYQIEYITNEKLIYILENIDQIVEYKKVLNELLYNKEYKDIWIKIANKYYESQKSLL